MVRAKYRHKARIGQVVICLQRPGRRQKFLALVSDARIDTHNESYRRAIETPFQMIHGISFGTGALQARAAPGSPTGCIFLGNLSGVNIGVPG
jgi:hypothetical protein